MNKDISLSTFDRLPAYLHYLNSRCGNLNYISATQIANGLNFGEVQVRKDLAQVCSIGKPKIGYNIEELKANLSRFLGCDRQTEAVIVGVGKLGQALMQSNRFKTYGLRILKGFDVDQNLIGKVVSDCEIIHIDNLESEVKKLGVKLAIITVPSTFAQDVANTLVSAGVKGIWNFASAYVVVPNGVALKNENLAGSLALLSRQINQNN